jgi:hypothetical protein
VDQASTAPQQDGFSDSQMEEAAFVVKNAQLAE